MVNVTPNVFADAVRAFWETRATQAGRQRESGVTDQGNRGQVTGGQQMNGFVDAIRQYICAAGVEPGCVYTIRGQSDLPGYFRATKQWDVVVVVAGRLLAAIELKSQVGSFGNNFNNRTEEALGTAVDLWTAYREGAFENSAAPWLGYLLLVQDCDRSRQPVRVNETHFGVFPEFRGTSYTRRYELLCRRLVRERHYSEACLLLTDKERSGLPVNYNEPATDLSAERFLTQLGRHLVANL